MSAAVLVCHRGASALAPENSLDAFRLAMTHGMDFSELDVHVTGAPLLLALGLGQDQLLLLVAQTGGGLEVLTVDRPLLAASDVTDDGNHNSTPQSGSHGTGPTAPANRARSTSRPGGAGALPLAGSISHLAPSMRPLK